MDYASEIHKATVTEANVEYVGSITIDEALIERTGLWPGERVLVVSNMSGARLETYVIVGPRGSGVICMNGATAHLIKAEEEIIIIGFELSDKPVEPRAILVDRRNRFVRDLPQRCPPPSSRSCSKHRKPDPGAHLSYLRPWPFSPAKALLKRCPTASQVSSGFNR